MPNLTGEELADLYPRAKTYDEIQAERELRREARRPKRVSLRIGIWTALVVPITSILYQAVSYMAAVAVRGPVLTGVSFSILLLVIGAAILYYLYSLIDGVASKVITANLLFNIILVGILSIAAVIGMVLLQLIDIWAVAATISLLVFTASYATTHRLLKYEQD